MGLASGICATESPSGLYNWLQSCVFRSLCIVQVTALDLYVFFIKNKCGVFFLGNNIERSNSVDLLMPSVVSLCKILGVL